MPKQTTLLDGETMIAPAQESDVVDAEIVNESAEPQPSNQLAVQSATPMSLIEAAITQGIDTDKLEKLLALQQRWEADQARKAYNKAMAKFRETHIVVLRNSTVTAGPLTGTRYAKLIDFVNAAIPPLSACGLSATWRITRDEKDWIEVACLVSHVDGHYESTTMGGPPDVGGAKNAIQARASTVAYLEKYTFKMALGLAEQNDDNDGNAPQADCLDAGQIAALEKELALIPPGEKALERMLKWANVESIANLPKDRFGLALQNLRNEARKFNS